MLTAIRGQHAKKILWVIAGAVITAFVLSGANTFLEQKKKAVIAVIGDRKIPIPNFGHYIDLARLDLILYGNLDNKRNPITNEQIIQKAGIYYRLLWKAGEANIEVTNREIVEWVNRNFSRGEKFDEGSYQRYIQYISRTSNLNLTPRSFEECMRELITINKLWEKLLDVTVSDEEVRALYMMDNQKAKIAYLFIPYEKFRVDIGIKPNEIEEFYRNNKALFQRKPTVNIEGALIDENKGDEQPAFTPALGEIEAEVKEELIAFRAKEEAKRFSSDLLKEINEKGIKNLSKFANKKNVEFKETDFFKYYDYIEGIGLDNRVSTIVFSLDKDEIHSEIAALDKGACILQLKDRTPVDEADFQTKRKDYYDKIEERKLFVERLKFIVKLNQEIVINFPSE